MKQFITKGTSLNQSKNCYQRPGSRSDMQTSTLLGVQGFVHSNNA